MNIRSYLQDALNDVHQALVFHPVYSLIDDLPRLRVFMDAHVFAVWDFMSLVKRLQTELTCVSLPWLPPRNPGVARLINEIVLEEETDTALDGAASHFETYLRAMDEVGASTGQIKSLIAQLERGVDLELAMPRAGVRGPIRDFVAGTMRVAMRGTPLDVAVCFLYGRENVIPEIFRSLRSENPNAFVTATNFVRYLDRHIELDGGSHREMATQILEQVCPLPTQRDLEQARRVGHAAIMARIRLWDEVVIRLHRRTSSDTATFES